MPQCLIRVYSLSDICVQCAKYEIHRALHVYTLYKVFHENAKFMQCVTHYTQQTKWKYTVCNMLYTLNTNVMHEAWKYVLYAVHDTLNTAYFLCYTLRIVRISMPDACLLSVDTPPMTRYPNLTSTLASICLIFPSLLIPPYSLPNISHLFLCICISVLTFIVFVFVFVS